MNNRVFAHLDLRNIVQADTLHHTAKVHSAYLDHPIGRNLFHSSRYRKAHGRPLSLAYTPFERRRSVIWITFRRRLLHGFCWNPVGRARVSASFSTRSAPPLLSRSF